MIPVTHQENKASKTQLKKIFTIVFIVFCLCVIAGSMTTALAYSITYRDVSIGNPKLEVAISQAVLGLPFSPKSNQYLMESMVRAQKRVSKHSFDLSLASQSNALIPTLGLSSFEMQAKGNIDYTDEQDVKMDMTASLANQYNVELRKADKTTTYLKVNKIPDLIYSFVGLRSSDVDPLLVDWIAFDTTPLNTDAKKYLDENSDQKKASQKLVDQLNKIFHEELILSKLEQTQDSIDGHETYKIHFVADPATIDYLGEKLVQEIAKEYPSYGMMYSQQVNNKQKLSDSVKKLSMDVWIDKKDYYLRKVVASVTILPDTNSKQKNNSLPSVSPSLLPEKAEYSFALAIKLDHFGEDFTVEVPEKSVEFKDLMDKIQEKVIHNTRYSNGAYTQPSSVSTDSGGTHYYYSPGSVEKGL